MSTDDITRRLSQSTSPLVASRAELPADQGTDGVDHNVDFGHFMDAPMTRWQPPARPSRRSAP
jgi:hypothetical protein